jgi:hypothetical protein
MDAAQESGDGRRRGTKNRGRLGKRKRPKGHNDSAPRGLPADKVFEGIGDDTSVLGRRIPRPGERRVEREEGPPNEFTLFCAYHLGITVADGYQKPQVEDVARRFGLSVEALRELLRENRLDDESVRRTRYDLEGAQYDIRVAPEGISKTEIARDLYEDFLASREQS